MRLFYTIMGPICYITYCWMFFFLCPVWIYSARVEWVIPNAQMLVCVSIGKNLDCRWMGARGHSNSFGWALPIRKARPVFPAWGLCCKNRLPSQTLSDLHLIPVHCNNKVMWKHITNSCPYRAVGVAGSPSQSQSTEAVSLTAVRHRSTADLHHSRAANELYVH